jgi:hypothetical protein
LQQVRGGAAAGRVEAHIERPIAHEGESAAAVIDLHARHAEIGQESIDTGRAFASEDVRQSREVRVMERKEPADGLELHEGRYDVRRIEVGGDEQSIRRNPLQQLDGMPAEAESAIDDGLPRLRIEDREDLLQQHRPVFAGRGGPPHPLPPKRPPLLLGEVRHRRAFRFPAVANELVANQSAQSLSE